VIIFALVFSIVLDPWAQAPDWPPTLLASPPAVKPLRGTSVAAVVVDVAAVGENI